VRPELLKAGNDARGLEPSPGSQCQSGNRLAQPAVLKLKVLQELHLLDLQRTELLPPPILYLRFGTALGDRSVNDGKTYDLEGPSRAPSPSS
jgi:hypothetical protein